MLHACWLSLCMINAHNVFLFFPFPLFVEIIEPTTSSPVTSPGQYPHTFTKYVWVLFLSSKISALSQKHSQLLLGHRHGCGSGVCHLSCLSVMWSPSVSYEWCLTRLLEYIVTSHGFASHSKHCELISYPLPSKTEVLQIYRSFWVAILKLFTLAWYYLSIEIIMRQEDI